MNKKIAVHVTNEEQWNEVVKYYGGDDITFKGCKDFYPDRELAVSSTGQWSYLTYYYDKGNVNEVLEFNEWQARVKEDKMEKIEVPQAVIEVPQAVYDEFKKIPFDVVAPYSVISRIAKHSDIFPYMREYLLGNDRISEDSVNQFNLLKVMMGQAEFVPIEEKYLWQEKQGRWLGYGADDEITDYPNRALARLIAETEIREKTSFDIDKLKKVSE